MQLLGIDLGSSSVKASVVDANTGQPVASAFYPKTEMEITANQPGWAEQDPKQWWHNMKMAVQEVLEEDKVTPSEIKSLGISYQMHGLVLVDKNLQVLRPSIIWCDSRAVHYGDKAFKELGKGICLEFMLNSPGNFTASKLKWVKENEPEIYNKIHKIMLPGDYLAMRMTGEVKTTVSGLSEGIFWNFKTHTLANALFSYYDLDKDFIPETTPTFGVQGKLSGAAAKELGLPSDCKVCYRAGDQPNNALSLNVLKPGEIAATAGTSGVVYGVADQIQYDPESRVNSFAHVNHSEKDPRVGILLCINGTGIGNAWIKRTLGEGLDYEAMNHLASKIKIGSDGLVVLPFGNGAERVLKNKNIGCHISNFSFNRHKKEHIMRAMHEGIAFSFQYGIEIMQNIGLNASVIRAGFANMFLSPVFRQTLANISGSVIELYDTDGAAGAARGAGIGAGVFNIEDAFSSLKVLKRIEPENDNLEASKEAYKIWLNHLHKLINE